MLETALGVALFTVIVMTAVAAVLAVHRLIAQDGTTTVNVNDSRLLDVPGGWKLLEALANAGILLPAGCGGRGTCGQCLVTITGGAEAPLPIETGRIARRELAAGVRLACQTVVRAPLRLRVPDEILGARRMRCTVRSARNVSTWIRELWLDAEGGAGVPFEAGAYVVVECPPYQMPLADLDIAQEYRGEWDAQNVWALHASAARPTSRAYSLANAPREAGLLLNVRLALPPPGKDAPPGIVSSYLFGCKEGDPLTVSGPYGSMRAHPGEREMILVGGGAGMAPLRSIVLDQIEARGSGRTISLWYGARSRREVFYGETFDALAAAHPNFRWVAALSAPPPGEDRDGPVGFIHEVLFEHYLKDHPAPEDCEYLLCGPPLMVTAVTGLLDSLGVPPENVSFDDFGG